MTARDSSSRVVLLGLVFAVTACGLGDGERFGRAGTSAGLLRVHLREPVVDVDPARAGSRLERAIARQLFSGLVEMVEGRPAPSLAVAWTQDRDRLVVRLREDAHFSDGTPLTADDVVWSWRRALRASTAASDLRLSATIANGDALARGTLLRIAPGQGGDASVRSGGAPYAVFRHTSAAERSGGASGNPVFDAGTPVRVVDTNARVARPNAAGLAVSVPLFKGPDDTAATGAALVPREVATVIGLVETKGRVMLQLRASGGAAGWAPAEALALHVPVISVVHVVDRGGAPPELRASADPSSAVRAQLRDESAVEILERGPVHSIVVDVASGKTGTIESAFLEDTLRERRWFLVEPVGSEGGGRGWVSEQDLAFDPALLDVVARGPHTLDVGLAVDVDRALVAFASPVARPVPRRIVEEHGRAWTDVAALVTSGPFTIVAHDPRGGLVLGRSPSSFEAHRARLERVELVYLQRATTALHLYRAGLLDALLDGALPKELAGTLSRASDWAPGALGGALIAPEVNGLEGSTLELRDVFVEPAVDEGPQ